MSVLIAVCSLFVAQTSYPQAEPAMGRNSIYRPTTWNVFVGGNLEREASQNLGGWNIAGSEYPYRAKSWVGATIEGAGAYETISGVSKSLYRITGGPSVAIRTGRVQPFARALFGEAIGTESVERFAVPASATVKSLAVIGGCGADWVFTSAVAFRAQADWVRNGAGSAINGVRSATGVVFRF